MRIVIGSAMALVAGAAIVWAGVQVQGELAHGEDLSVLPFVVAALALVVLVLVALLSDTLNGRNRRRARPPKEHG